MTPETAVRLKKGAALLGELWRTKVRCSSGWQMGCDCQPDSRTKFCKAKDQWLAIAAPRIAAQFGDSLESSKFGLIEAMTAAESDATGLTARTDVPGMEDVGIGPAGSLSMSDMRNMMDAPDGASATLKLFKVFPGSKVVKDDGGRKT